MNLTIHGNHVEVSPALRDHVTSKLLRIERHFDQVIDATVQDSLAKNGILATAHIREWYGHGFGLLRLHRRRYRYREYEHLLEVYSR